MGRIRHLPDIRSSDAAKAATAERQAVNSVVQGSASDIIKLAMINVDRRLGVGASWPACYPTPRILMQIHDELIYEVSTADPQCVVLFQEILRGAMEGEVVQALKLTVPLVINISSGPDWGSFS